jgi:hypothetical protein
MSPSSSASSRMAARVSITGVDAGNAASGSPPWGSRRRAWRGSSGRLEGDATSSGTEHDSSGARSDHHCDGPVADLNGAQPGALRFQFKDTIGHDHAFAITAAQALGVPPGRGTCTRNGTFFTPMAAPADQASTTSGPRSRARPTTPTTTSANRASRPPYARPRSRRSSRLVTTSSATTAPRASPGRYGHVHPGAAPFTSARRRLQVRAAVRSHPGFSARECVVQSEERVP